MIFPRGECNIMILPCGQSAVQTKRGQTAKIRSHRATNQLTHPYQGCMDNALVHYTPYSPGRGGLTITCTLYSPSTASILMLSVRCCEINVKILQL